MNDNQIRGFLRRWDCQKVDCEALKKAILPKGETQLKTQVLLDGLFDLLYPAGHVLIGRVVDAVKLHFTLEASERKGVEAEFAELSKGTGSISWRRFRKTINNFINNHVCDSNIKRKISYDAQVHQHNRLLKAYGKNDSTVHESEFTLSVAYVGMLVSLIPYNIDDIALMERNVFNGWLIEKLELIGDMESYTDALVREFMPNGGSETQIQVIIDGIFDRAFAFDVRDPSDFSKFTTWQILGASEEDTRHIQGLQREASNVRVVGGAGLKAWEFDGNATSFVKISSPVKNGLGKSLTVATFFYQDVLNNGPILEFEGDTKFPCGFHFWYWDKRGLFANFRTIDGHEHNVFFELLTPKQWHFVGVSYDYGTGNVLMWIDNDIMEKNIGKLEVDLAGEVFCGIRPSSPKWRPFKGRLAGLVLLNGPTHKEKIAGLKEKVAGMLN
ncbi:uncharacterized protein LOC135496231 [Lineus longissimus]|uniref:uncharacterized protein LOC135496231 n=1 Tax=Lineus longissimus TaxID=88925 RepID=UPI002B4EB2B2